jgi:hypothetical protein
MKRIIVLAVAVVLILGLVFSTGALAEGPPSPPAPFATENTVLVTICEDVVLEPGQSAPGVPCINAQDYRLFKIYAYMKPGEGINCESTEPFIVPEDVRVRVRESATGAYPGGTYAIVISVEDWNEYCSSSIPHYGMAVPFGKITGPYSYLKPWIKNYGDVPVTVSMHLLMAKE